MPPKTTTTPAPVETRRGPSPRLISAARDELRARGVPAELQRIRPVRPGVVELDLTPGVKRVTRR
jgi:hypothetical protein